MSRGKLYIGFGYPNSILLHLSILLACKTPLTEAGPYRLASSEGSGAQHVRTLMLGQLPALLLTGVTAGSAIRSLAAIGQHTYL